MSGAEETESGLVDLACGEGKLESREGELESKKGESMKGKNLPNSIILETF